MNGGRFDFDDGGTYCGGWEEGKAHGYGVCTGPQGKGEYAGAWHYGFEVSGVYTWPSGNTYQGQWQNGKRHGLGIENRGKWIYKGEWTQGYKGRYGQRKSLNSPANYLGTWSSGFHDGYGTETYVDGGSYQGQWQRGMRYGYGIRKSAAYGVAVKFRSRSHTNASMTSLRSDYGEEEEAKGKEDEIDESEACKGGFVLRSRSDAPQKRRRSLSERSLAVKRTILSGLRIKKQHSTGDIHQRVASISGSLRSSGSTMSCASVESHGMACNKAMDHEDKIDEKATEIYRGEWKNDKRSGFGICERSDGLKYEGEWLNNRKNGYGITYFKDGTKEEGRYKNNILIYSTRRKGIMFVRSSKLRERIESSVEAAKRAASIAQQKAEIAITRTMTAKERAELSIGVGEQSREDAELARMHAKNFDPSYKHPGTDTLKVNRQHNRQLLSHISGNTTNHVSFDSSLDPVSNQVSFDYSVYNQGNNSGGNDNINTMERPPTFGQYSQHPSQDYTTPEEEQNISLGQKVQFQQQYHNNDSSIQHHNQNHGHNNPHQSQIHYYQYNTNQLGSNYPSSGQNPRKMSSQYYSTTNTATNPTTTITNNNNVVQQPPTTNITSSISQDVVNHHQQYNNNSNITSNNDIRKNVTTDDNNILTQSDRKQSNNYEISGGNSNSNNNDDNLNTEQQHTIKNNPHNSGNFSNSSSLKEDISSKGQTLTPNRYNTNLSKTSINSSNFSLNDDHYEQYKYLTGESDQGLKLRRNRPSLMRQSDVNNPDSNHFINRRSTLAGSRDRPPLVQDSNAIGALKKEQSSSFDRGSLPNLTDLSQAPVTMHREDASRLASQRRQEAQRLLEEEEMLRNNPFRYFTHPSLRNWLLRYRIPLILIFANLFLLYILVQLLTYKKNSSTGEE
uniref:Junctophilin (projected from Caenorhabditis elegans ortholog jph-1) n=1 Tax=Strongyloides venezuelensis TaxID=75913 RepID=A0A0K0FNW5_STRVS